MNARRKKTIKKLVTPVQQFIQQEKSGGVVLGISVVIALFLANSPWSDDYFHFFEQKFGFLVNGQPRLEFSLHHWINDGLMAIFFFVVGLELKREFISGELSNPRKAMLPIGAALGGMIVPAIIYLSLNYRGEAASGWGIPMATDIAFALGVLYLLGDRIPLSLKVFLTALAIVDDLGAVLVIAFFYTSDISSINLFIGLACALIMFIGNKMGVRSIVFYLTLGIAGVWTAFLLSGVHATIAGVLAAFTIPADVKIGRVNFLDKIQGHLGRLEVADRNAKGKALTSNEMQIMTEFRKDAIRAISPLQRLENAMHPFVTFVIIPIFALANAGVSVAIDMDQLFSSNVALGVGLGLLVGKVAGIVGFSMLLVRFKIAQFPASMNFRNLVGLGLLGAIGFTMSLFVISLAFTDPVHIVQAKIGIFAASILGGVLGYWVLSRSNGK